MLGSIMRLNFSITAVRRFAKSLLPNKSDR
ncbi:MAG: hypothetical protein ACI85U_003115 [Candidatus Promineifilaceae bacterium]|jgi:hypothetical protein